MLPRTVVLVAFAALTAGAACSDLKVASTAADDPEEESPDPSSPEDAGGDRRPDAEAPPPDAGEPPMDFECSADPWTKETKAREECAPRRVRDVVTEPAILPTGVSIARTPAGRVGIVFNSEVSAEEGTMVLVHFIPSTPTFEPKVVTNATGFAFHDGLQTRIAATGPDTLHVLAHDVEDDSRSGEVRLYRLVNGAAPLVGSELVMAGVKHPAELGFAVASNGDTFVTVRATTDATTAKLAARMKRSGSDFVPLPDVTTSLSWNAATGAGASSLFVDPTGQVHLLYHHVETSQHSTPRYHSLDGTSWSYRKTIDNAIVDGLCGYSPRIVASGTKKYALYYFRKAGQSPPATADLRLATWTSSNDTPTIEILDQSIPSEDAANPTYRAAMAIDAHGLLHLALVRPTSSTRGYLEYRRQTRVAGGGTKWLSDIVDPEVVTETGSALVDLVVDDAGRPHIAYWSAKDGRVKYATRYDR